MEETGPRDKGCIVKHKWRQRRIFCMSGSVQQENPPPVFQNRAGSLGSVCAKKRAQSGKWASQSCSGPTLSQG